MWCAYGTIETRAAARGWDVEDAVPYRPRPEACIIVGGGVPDAPLLALSILHEPPSHFVGADAHIGPLLARC